jgi:predicted DNA-binding transcriptional regulator AlpA
MPKPAPILPLVPIGLRLPRAAAYVDMSPSKFLELVERGIFPKPKSVDRVRVWDRRRLDEAFEMLPGDEETTGWEDVK